MLFFEVITRLFGTREVAVTVALSVTPCCPLWRPRDDFDMATVIIRSIGALIWLFLPVKLQCFFWNDDLFGRFRYLGSFNSHSMNVLSKVIDVSQETHLCIVFDSPPKSCFSMACTFSTYPWYLDPTATKRIEQGNKELKRRDSLQRDRQIVRTPQGYRNLK